MNFASTCNGEQKLVGEKGDRVSAEKAFFSSRQRNIEQQFSRGTITCRGRWCVRYRRYFFTRDILDKTRVGKFPFVMKAQKNYEPRRRRGRRDESAESGWHQTSPVVSQLLFMFSYTDYLLGVNIANYTHVTSRLASGDLWHCWFLLLYLHASQLTVRSRSLSNEWLNN